MGYPSRLEEVEAVGLYKETALIAKDLRLKQDNIGDSGGYEIHRSIRSLIVMDYLQE
jgi:hypothetical protein